jgi:hypothetical protein
MAHACHPSSSRKYKIGGYGFTMGKGLMRPFLKQGTQTAHKHTERGSPSISSEVKIKTTRRYRLIAISMAAIK